MALGPKESARLISNLSTHVKVIPEGVKKASEFVSKGLQEQNFCLREWWRSHELNPDSSLPSTLDWVFLIDTLNFSFWADKGKEFSVTFHGKAYTGYWSLCAAVNRAMEEGINITSPTFYSNVSIETLKHIFRTDNGIEMPLMEERHRILNETGKCLMEKFDSTFATCVKMANHKAADLLKLVLENFPSYKDEATYKGHHVSFYKRAQILVGDLWVCFEGKGYGHFTDIECLTIFADYRIPQVLVYLGALEYSETLLNLMKNDTLLENGNEYEVEIRGCTIWAVELIYQCVKQQQNEGKLPQNLVMNSILIDNYLWQYRREHAKETEHVPYHKVRSIYY